MGALLDNLEVLTSSDESGEWERAATADILNKRIKIRSPQLYARAYLSESLYYCR